MTTYYTQFYEEMTEVTPAEAEWIETVLGFDFDNPKFKDREEALAAFKDLLNIQAEDAAEDFDPDWWPGFEWSTKGAEKGTLALHCDEGFQENNLCLFMKAFIRKFRPDYIFTLSGACTSSKRYGSLGGIWLVINKDSAIGGSTWSEIEEVVDALTPGKNDGKPA